MEQQAQRCNEPAGTWRPHACHKILSVRKVSHRVRSQTNATHSLSFELGQEKHCSLSRSCPCTQGSSTLIIKQITTRALGRLSWTAAAVRPFLNTTADFANIFSKEILHTTPDWQIDMELLWLRDGTTPYIFWKPKDLRFFSELSSTVSQGKFGLP